jgi:hypothetical protein
VATVDKNDCKEFRHGLGREIGQVRTDAKAAKDCAGKKLEKGTFRWTIGIMILVLGGILTFVSGLVIYNGRTVNSSEKTVAGMEGKVDATKEKVDGMDRDFRDFRTEQRTRLEEIKDLVKSNH